MGTIIYIILSSFFTVLILRKWNPSVLRAVRDPREYCDNAADYAALVGTILTVLFFWPLILSFIILTKVLLVWLLIFGRLVDVLGKILVKVSKKCQNIFAKVSKKRRSTGPQ